MAKLMKLLFVLVIFISSSLVYAQTPSTPAEQVVSDVSPTESPIVDTTTPDVTTIAVTTSEEPTTQQPPSTTSVDCANDFKFKCADCRNIAICAGSSTPLRMKSCESISAATPYCHNDHCTSELPDNEICEAEFRCSALGYFPHPSDCSKYYLCDQANGGAHEYSCGPNRVFNSKDKTCGNKIQASDCQIIDCSKTANSFIRYTPHLAFYAFCFESAEKKETIVYKCEDEVTSEFNMNTLTCDYKCPAEGRFVDPSDCTKFYECSKVGNVLQAATWSCPIGARYNLVMKHCEAGLC